MKKDKRKRKDIAYDIVPECMEIKIKKEEKTRQQRRRGRGIIKTVLQE